MKNSFGIKKEAHTMENLTGHMRSYFVLLGGIKDHKGNEYYSIEDMCKAYNIEYAEFYSRIVTNRKLEWSLEKALTEPVKKWVVSEDHLGQKYRSKKAMCTAWGISLSAYEDHIKAGMSVKEALTTKGNAKKPRYKDHEGNLYVTKIEMCRAYGVTTSAYDSRISSGWTVKDALTVPTKLSLAVDDDGVLYNSVASLCAANGISAIQYNTLVAGRGLSVEDVKVLKKYKRAPLTRLIAEGKIGKGTLGKKGIALEVARVLKSMGYSFKENQTIGNFIDVKEKAINEQILSFSVYTENELVCFLEIDTTEHFWDSALTGGKRAFKKTVYNDIIKETYLEEQKCPLLRVRFDQSGNIGMIIDRAFANINKCVEQHNPILTNKEYWAIRHDFDSITLAASEKTEADLPVRKKKSKRTTQAEKVAKILHDLKPEKFSLKVVVCDI